VGPLDTLPGRVIGAKPAVCRWIITLLGAAPGDILDDLFPGYASCKVRADASSLAASDTSYPSCKASPAPMPHCARNLPCDRPHRAGDGPVPWPGSPPGPWLLARVLPEAQRQGWPKAISRGNAA